MAVRSFAIPSLGDGRTLSHTLVNAQESQELLVQSVAFTAVEHMQGCLLTLGLLKDLLARHMYSYRSLPVYRRLTADSPAFRPSTDTYPD